MIIDKHKWKFVKCNIMPALRRLILDRPSPMFVGIFLTRNCNLECSYCFTRRKSKDPTTAEIKKRIDKVKELGCNIIYFMGGEPLLRKDLLSLTKYCSKKHIFTVMNTNGTLLSKDIIKSLAEAGMNALVVSLDGINEVKQSKKTLTYHPGLLNNLEYAIRKGMKVTINTVITSSNSGEAAQLLELLKDRKIMMTTCLVTRHMSTVCSTGKNTKYNTEEQKKLSKLFDIFIKKIKQGYPVFEPVFVYERMKEFVRGKYSWRCNAGRHFFSVDCDGKVSLCPESVSLDIYFLSLDKEYYRKHKKIFFRQLKACNKSCVENYAVCESYYSDHKLNFFLRGF